MTFQVGILALVAAINALVTSMAWHCRDSTLARQYFSWMMAAATFYAAVAAMEAGSIDLANKIFWSTLEYVGTGGIIIFFVLFTEAYVHGRSRFTRQRLIWLSLWPLINIALVATNTWHRWVWVDVVLAAPPSNSAIYSHGPGYAFVLACLYLYSLWGIHLLGRASLSGGPLHQRQARWLLAGALFPYLGGTLYSLELTPANLNLTPMSFMATGLLCFWGLFRMGVFEAIPIARETLIEHLRDGVIVVNLEHQVIDINPQGRSLTKLKGSAVGRSIHSALSNIPELLHHYDQGTETPFCLWTDSHNTCHITVQSSALKDYRGKTHGRLLVLRDTTHQYLAELKLRQANTRLSLQLQEIEGLQVKLQTQASRDQLTGLFNRHHLHETLPQVLLQARQKAYSVAFIMLDIDYFKRVNDTFGHRAGDLLIQAFSQILLVQIQEGETAYRLGGEEFLLILPHATLESGIQRADYIRQEFNVSAVPWNGKDIRTTVSGGVATFPNHATQADDLLHAVDLALYAAKKSGRNQITCFNPRIHQPSSV
ncbi:MAG: diguanylate cyclase [Tildeniella torsiva UHER 1998/13D]|nr:diguanylate cyclase [Tildeniella torsiva UHER 1998/13D]